VFVLALIPIAHAFQENIGDGWHMVDVREIQVVTHGSTLIIYFSYDIDFFIKFYSWVVGAGPVEDYLRNIIIGLEDLETITLNPLGGEAIFRITNATSYQQGWYYYTESHEFSQQIELLRLFAVVPPNTTYYEASDTLVLPSFYYRG
jgi:hypothetical protein